jgi:hypothetical protein
VTTKGVPVARATVQLHEAAPDAEPSSRRWLDTVRSAEDGSFTFWLAEPGTYVVRAWHDVHGEGVLPATDLGLGERDGLEIELDRPPATIRGRVLLPEDHGPDEIWLWTPSSGFLHRLLDDGSFEASGLPPGPCSVEVLAGSGMDDHPPGESFWISHPPSGPPAWVEHDVPTHVVLAPGETLTVDLDLTAVPPYRLLGSFTLDRELPEHAVPDGHWGSDQRTIALEADGRPGFVARAHWSAGRFELASHEAGTFRLTVPVSLADGTRMTVTDRVTLTAPETTWTFAPSFGALRLLPSATADSPTPVPSVTLRWRGAGDLEATLRFADLDRETGQRRFASVPAGIVEVLLRPDESAGTAVVEPGTVTDFRMP